MKLKILVIVILGAVGVGAAVVALGGLPTGAAAASQYLTSPVTTGDVTDDSAATGTIASATSYGLAFGTAPHLVGSSSGDGSTTWTVTDLKVKSGDTVKAGDVLATADTTDLRRQLAAAIDAWRVASIQYTIAKETLADASGTDAIRQAKINVYNARTQLSSAKDARQGLSDQIAAATLKAPIDGVVTTVSIVTGLEAPSGDAIVIDSTDLQVTADVVEGDLTSMQLGQAATVTIGAVGTDVTGTVVAIAPIANDSSTTGVVSYPVTIALTDAPATARSGMTADITITIESATNVLNVPATALRGTAGAYTVLVMGTDGQPISQPVEVGLVTSSLAEITSGLTEGQEVVTGVNTAQNGTTTNNGGFGGGGVAIPGGGGFRDGPRVITGN
jgi:membrane fusion protein, macrolide-specific efflux system